MTAEERGLLAAVVANADDDVPRLVYADWLEEQGRPERAEFIRVQCRLAAAAPDDPEYPELLDREAELMAWLDAFEPVPSATGQKGLQPDRGYEECVRGFPYTASHFGGRDRKVVARLTAAVEKLVATTTVREVRLYALSPEQVAEFLRQPVVAHLRGLTIQPGSEDDDEFELTLDPDEVDEGSFEIRRPIGAATAAVIVGALARSPHATGLRDLRLFAPLTLLAVEALAQADLGNLTRLHVEFHPDDAAAVGVLGRAPWFRNLRHLGVGDRLGNREVLALCQLPPLPNLRTLYLGDNWIESAGLATLAKAKAFPRLVELSLGRTRIGAEGVRALAGSKTLRPAVLDLRACEIGTGGAEALARSEFLAGACVLDVGANDIGPKGVAALAKSPHSANLRHLTLAFNGVGAAGLDAVAASPHLKGLTRLELSTLRRDLGAVRTRDVSAFLEHLDMPNLRHLNLEGLPVNVTGARKLAANPSLVRLTTLVLDECRIGDAGLAAIAASPHLRGLLRLGLFDNHLGTGAGVLADPDVFPRAAVRILGNELPDGTRRKLRKRKGIWV